QFGGRPSERALPRPVHASETTVRSRNAHEVERQREESIELLAGFVDLPDALFELSRRLREPRRSLLNAFLELPLHDMNPRRHGIARGAQAADLVHSR